VILRGWELQNAGIGTVILIRDHEYVGEDRGAPADLAGEMRAMGLHVAGGLTEGLTITIHLIRCADAPPTAGLGDGGGTVTWLPGRVLTAGRAAAVDDGRGSQPDSGRLTRVLSRLVV
jgi:hypothetical protein